MIASLVLSTKWLVYFPVKPTALLMDFMNEPDGFLQSDSCLYQSCDVGENLH